MNEQNHVASADIPSATQGFAPEVLELEFLKSDDWLTYMVRGHVDLDKMKAAVTTELDGDVNGYREPNHAWFRAVPKKGFDVWYERAEEKTRGAFPVTIMAKPW